MKKVRAQKDFDYDGIAIQPGNTFYMPDITAYRHESKGNVEILLIPENRQTK